MKQTVTEADRETARNIAPAVLAWYSREEGDAMGLPHPTEGLYITASRRGAAARARRRVSWRGRRVAQQPRTPKMSRLRLLLECRSATEFEGLASRPEAAVWTRPNWTPADLEDAVSRAVAAVRSIERRAALLADAMGRAKRGRVDMLKVSEKLKKKHGTADLSALIRIEGACELVSELVDRELEEKKKPGGSQPASRGSGRKPRGAPADAHAAARGLEAPAPKRARSRKAK